MGFEMKPIPKPGMGLGLGRRRTSLFNACPLNRIFTNCICPLTQDIVAQPVITVEREGGQDGGGDGERERHTRTDEEREPPLP